MNWTYVTIMTAAIATGLLLFRWTAAPLHLRWTQKLGLAMGAFIGGMVGAKLPFVLADWQGLVNGSAWLDDGKTIVAGLVGGYLGVLLAEWIMNIRLDACDSFAMPVAAAVAVGRLACFNAGCCHGTVTSIPWGMDFGDGQLRHPTQLYESAFHLTAAIVLYQLYRRGMFKGQLIRVYFVSYFVYRFFSEFVRPEPRLYLGLTGYQLAALLLVPFFALWCCSGCCVNLRADRSRRFTKLAGEEGPLKSTRTLCPQCLMPLEGTTLARNGEVLLQRECPEHGLIETLVCSDRRHYYLRDEVPHPPLESGCCSAEPGHRTCVALLELTEACNLRCPVCFAQSPRGGHRTLEELEADLRTFLDQRGSLDILQLSGGEPLLHPNLLEIIDHCRELPIDHVMINTNGLELLESDTLAGELARRTPNLELNLQMDGLDAETHTALRGKDLSKEKLDIIDRLVEHDLPTTLVCTLVRDVNEHEVGPLLRFAMDTPQIRGITFQPATFCGRFAADRHPESRVTLADVVRLVAEGSNGLFDEEDFIPLPCANPNCCSVMYAQRPRRGRLQPLTRKIDYEAHLDQVSDRMNFNLADVRQCCGMARRPEDYFRLVIKPFMDAYSYDQDRIDECCVHVIQPGGQAMSFCRFNILERTNGAGQSRCCREEVHDIDRV